MGGFRIEYDKDFGLNKMSGWSISDDGHYVIFFERYLFIALLKYFIYKIKGSN